MPATRLTAVVFDFDGTLAELHIDFELMKRRLAALAEVFLDEPQHADGLPALEWVEALAERVAERSGRDMGLEFHTRCRFLITDMELKAAAKGRLFAHTRPLLARLREHGLKLGVITRNCTPAVGQVFPDAAEHLDCVLPREAVVRVKPDPEHLLAALARLGAEPGQSLMVGDHPMDIETGRRAGTLTAAVAGGNTPLEGLRRAGPDFAAPDCAALFEISDLRALLGGAGALGA